jgi:wyosine [tRNA(Phe)-imidazoG37] synthetase (radical SAM superfamily)
MFTVQYVNRPHRDIGFEVMVNGLAEFRERFYGQVWLEVFLLGGVTGIDSEVKKIAALARRIRPERVQLNTVSRPPAEEFAYSVSANQMEVFANLFDRKAEVISEEGIKDGDLFYGTKKTK